MTNSLYIVATPIGNLSDISERALETLRSVDVILCEDTRVTGKLLSRYKIKKPLLSYHQHSKPARIDEILTFLEDGKDLALVTDAGTPGISDPGGKLIEAIYSNNLHHLSGSSATENGVEVVPIPGPCALVTALSVSGFPADRFVFFGFPPHKKGRKMYFNDLVQIQSTIVFYESTHRILKTLKELEFRISDRQIVVCRELTKLHETIYRGSVKEVTKQLKTGSIKGEYVVILSPLNFRTIV